MSSGLLEHAAAQLAEIESQGLLKGEREIASPQGALVSVRMPDSTIELLNLCANNYLGLADHPDLIAAAKAALDDRGFGMASVRFICGAQDLHLELERAIGRFLGTEATILFSSCFDANAGLFEALLGPEDAIVSDALNHASIIDGVRLCKAKRLRYANSDMAELESRLREAKDCRHRLIATDGVFSMDGFIANLPEICDLAERHDALVMVDDSHAVGFVGENGRGTPEYWGVADRIALYTGTMGKALGGASGGYVSGRKPLIDLLRQRARPYLFSNSLAPAIVAAALKALDMLSSSGDLRTALRRNAAHFRAGMQAAGFALAPGDHPIVPVMLGDAKLARDMADELMRRGIYVTAFSFPVVPRGQARIRTQMSAAHSAPQIDRAIQAFTDVGHALGVL